MLAFEILVNGKRLCLAGTDAHNVFSTIVSWGRRADDRINFHVGGIVSGDSHDHYEWTTPAIGIGDEVTIRIMDSEKCDEPDRTYQPPSRQCDA